MRKENCSDCRYYSKPYCENFALAVNEDHKPKSGPVIDITMLDDSGLDVRVIVEDGFYCSNFKAKKERFKK